MEIALFGNEDFLTNVRVFKLPVISRIVLFVASNPYCTGSRVVLQLQLRAGISKQLARLNKSKRCPIAMHKLYST
jgi:hypothetical protein